jgi:hypothetical protein
MCVSLIIISCIDSVSIWYAFLMFIFLKFLGSVIRKLHFLITDSKIIHAACIWAAVTVLATEIKFIYQENHV